MAATTFCPVRHGFPFPNSFPAGTPVVEVPTPFGRVRVGDASGGVCGGMVFAALDLFLSGRPRPDAAEPPLFRYLCRRLLDSWNLPFGVLKYYDWQARPMGSTTFAGVPVRSGVSRLTADVEWPRVRAALDAGLPAPLGLVKAHSFRPTELGRNHQVLAYGYELAGDRATLHVYDPNYPGDADTTLTASLADPDAGRPVAHSREGETVRGFFLTEYRRPLDVPTF